MFVISRELSAVDDYGMLDGHRPSYRRKVAQSPGGGTMQLPIVEGNRAPCVLKESLHASPTGNYWTADLQLC